MRGWKTKEAPDGHLLLSLILKHKKWTSILALLSHFSGCKNTTIPETRQYPKMVIVVNR